LRRRSVAKFVELNRWDRAAGTWVDEDWQGAVAWGGLDLSSNTDLTAFGLVTPSGDGWMADTLCWLPENSLDRVEAQCHVPLARWAKEGWLRLTEGDVVDYRTVRADILARVAALGCQVAEIGFDPFAATETVQYLQDEGITMVPIRQTYLSLSPPTKALERLVLGSTVKRPLFRHRGHPVLRWMADCIDVARDQNDNIKPAKPDRYKSSKRIDGVAAHVNALARALVHEVPVEVPAPEIW
jgi:phage terminase large subunit-like protein